MGETRIDWVRNDDGTAGETLNPLVGCSHGCGITEERPEGWCYARKQAKRAGKRCPLCYTFTPHGHTERLNALYERKKPQTYFIDSMWDFCCIGNPPGALAHFTEAMRDNPRHRYIGLTKAPHNMLRLYAPGDLPNSMWVGVSINNQADVWRLAALKEAANALGLRNLFISFEPLHEAIDIELFGCKWIIIGQETGRGKTTQTDPEWAHALIEQAFKRNIHVFVKDNLIGKLRGEYRAKTIPWQH